MSSMSDVGCKKMPQTPIPHAYGRRIERGMRKTHKHRKNSQCQMFWFSKQFTTQGSSSLKSQQKPWPTEIFRKIASETAENDDEKTSPLCLGYGEDDLEAGESNVTMKQTSKIHVQMSSSQTNKQTGPLREKLARKHKKQESEKKRCELFGICIGFLLIWKDPVCVLLETMLVGSSILFLSQNRKYKAS